MFFILEGRIVAAAHDFFWPIGVQRIHNEGPWKLAASTQILRRSSRGKRLKKPQSSKLS